MRYNRIMPGAKSTYLKECLSVGFIGVDFGINIDLSNDLRSDVKHFKDKYRPVYLETRPDKSKVAAGLACGSIWTVCCVLKKGDIVVYESTVYPGVTEDECVPVLERFSSLIFNKDFYAGYSPERIKPGDKKHTVTKIKKVISHLL